MVLAACYREESVPRPWAWDPGPHQNAGHGHDTGDALPRASGYGYLWWIGRDARTGLEYRMAVGYGGQFIFVVPARNTTIAAATAWSGVRDADANFMLVLNTICHTILPSLG